MIIAILLIIGIVGLALIGIFIGKLWGAWLDNAMMGEWDEVN